ncbi:hypothetical protein MUO79_11635 [Candidatus Bathyarchaeota archaeon]|nr:hypothetical protein [Candidatus Bathyarchaeota archaeon]
MTTDQETLNQVTAEVNKVLQKMGLVFESPRFRYYRIKKDKYAFGWTTEKSGDRKFYAFVYRITKKAWKLTKKVKFGRRKTAKARAYKWYCVRKEKLKQP